MNSEEAIQLGYSIAYKKCSTPEECAALNRDLRRYGNENAAMMLAMMTGEDCPELWSSGEVDGVQQGIAKRRWELQEPLDAARELELAAEWEQQQLEAQREEARRKSLGPTLIKKDLSARGWSRQQIASLGPPDFVVMQKSWKYKWQEHHYALTRVEEAEKNRAFASA